LVILEAHADFIRSDEGFLLREDVQAWSSWYGDHGFFKNHALKAPPDSPEFLILTLDKLFFLFPEFRSLMDFRMLRVPHLRWHAKDDFRRATDLYITCPSIGPRFRIQHGQNTYVLANEIGSDFFVNHNVTIGAGPRGIPKIGCRVSVGKQFNQS
jgi:hypothetical protein